MRFNVKFSIIDQKVPVSFKINEQKIPLSFKMDGQKAHLNFKINEQKIPLRFKHFLGVTQLGDDVESYMGEYVATPTDKVQSFPTRGKMMGRDFIVNPIPEEYGRVIYDSRGIITII